MPRPDDRQSRPRRLSKRVETPVGGLEAKQPARNRRSGPASQCVSERAAILRTRHSHWILDIGSWCWDSTMDRPQQLSGDCGGICQPLASGIDRSLRPRICNCRTVHRSSIDTHYYKSRINPPGISWFSRRHFEARSERPEMSRKLPKRPSGTTCWRP